MKILVTQKGEKQEMENHKKKKKRATTKNGKP
jgi:hypothetical protein